MTRCDDARLLLGSYALGGLEEDETRLVERHLATCADCRLAHAQLQPLPALLDLVEAETPVEHRPSPWLEDSVVANLRPRMLSTRPPRRRRFSPPALRIALPSALAGAALAAAVLTATGVLGGTDGQTREVTLASAPSTGGRAMATARLASTATGTRVELDARLPPLRGGEVYELWFVRPDGRVSAGTFTVDAAGRADLELATAATVERYQRLGITREPDALDPARNGPTVVAAPLAS